MSTWINVTDQKPPDGQRVLCYCPKLAYNYLGISVSGIRLGYYDKMLDMCRVDWTSYDYVFTHWMPLPKPPKVRKKRMKPK